MYAYASMEYSEFLASKILRSNSQGIQKFEALHPSLFDFQREITEWAIRKGRAALFESCGLGKTRQQLSWGDVVAKHTDKPIILFAPLSVAEQTFNEAQEIGVKAQVVADQSEVRTGINITNYEKLHRFIATEFGGVILDESSILKSQDGAYRTLLIESFRNHPYRLACTATPAPNDHMELGNHSEFLGVMSRSEMLSMFFVHDGGDTSQWRLKGHAEEEFWKWMCSWSVMIQKPSDLGYSDAGFILPELKIKNTVVTADVKASDDMLFSMPASSLLERRQARRDSLIERVESTRDIICGHWTKTTESNLLELSDTSAEKHPQKWLVWCNLNSEQDALQKALSGLCVSIQGSTPLDERVILEKKWRLGNVPILITKPDCFGYGMNWQHCHNVAFVGLSDSWEAYHQAIRRCWRFGQEQEVTAHVITSHLENAVLENIKRKEADHELMASSMIKHMKTEMELALHGGKPEIVSAKHTVEKTGEGWTMRKGDCVDLIKEVPDDSVHYTIFSPPFASLYTYSDSEKDMGNCRNADEFMDHFKFLTSELYRTTIPGRLLSFHCMNLPTSKTRDGYIGISDFRGDLIKTFQQSGFIYHSEVVIWKDPVTAMQRTKALGLLHKQIVKDSCMSRQGIPDYLVTMRKPGVNPEPVRGPFERYVGDKGTGPNGSLSEEGFASGSEKTRFSIEVWQRYASPVWMDINPSETLQKESAREQRDERHIAPLQLQVIRRALDLWTNPGDLVLSPFAGIGSEGWESIKQGREFIGFELKESYFKQAVANLETAVAEKLSLFDIAENTIVKKNSYAQGIKI